MDNSIKSVQEVFLIYLEYLNQWNKSNSIESLIRSIQNDPLSFDSGELINICQCEWVDAQSLTEVSVMKIKDFLNHLLVYIRDKKLDNIINGNATK
jgi:hypothetical protein